MTVLVVPRRDRRGLAFLGWRGSGARWNSRRHRIGLPREERMEETDPSVHGVSRLECRGWEEEGYGVPVGNLVYLVVVKWRRA